MKDNFIHICFVVDESGSMYDSVKDVVGGFKQIIDEQKRVKEGRCAVSLYTFADSVKEIFVGKDVNDVDTIVYHPHGCTAMNDGIGTAIDNIGKWLDNMPEDEKPSKNLIVIMTDGEENSSREYSLERVKEMIKHQQDVYSWSFMFLGADITNLNDAQNLGLRMSSVTTKANMYKNYDMINTATSLYRMSEARCAAVTMDSYMDMESKKLSDEYEKETGNKLS